MPLQIGNPSSVATAAQLAEIFHAITGFNRSPLPGASVPMDFPSTGDLIDLPLTADGVPTAPAWPSTPADAVALRLWTNGSAVDDGLAIAVRSAILSNAGGGAPLASNTSINRGALDNASAVRQPSRNTSNGGYIVMPLPAKGAAVPATWRLALLNTNGIRLRGHFIPESSGFPYLMTCTEEFLLSGTASVNAFTFPVATAAKFPAGYKAVAFQVIGAGALMTVDGKAGTPTSSIGIPLPEGRYLWDQAAHKIALSAVKFWLPQNTSVVGHAWN